MEKEKFVDFKGKRFYPPFKCLCCGKEIPIKQFCYGRLCPFCDCGNCCHGNVGYDKGHGRKDIFEEAEDVPKGGEEK